MTACNVCSGMPAMHFYTGAGYCQDCWNVHHSSKDRCAQWLLSKLEGCDWQMASDEVGVYREYRPYFQAVIEDVLFEMGQAFEEASSESSTWVWLSQGANGVTVYGSDLDFAGHCMLSAYAPNESHHGKLFFMTPVNAERDSRGIVVFLRRSACASPGPPMSMPTGTVWVERNNGWRFVPAQAPQ